MYRKIRIALGVVIAGFSIGATAATPQQLNDLAQSGAKLLEAYKTPAVGKSRCMLSPITPTLSPRLYNQSRFPGTKMNKHSNATSMTNIQSKHIIAL